MERRIDARIAALAEAIKRRKMEQEAPMDGLSRSLFEFRRELAALDALGKSALLYELNHGDPLEGAMRLDLSMEDLERMVEGMKV